MLKPIQWLSIALIALPLSAGARPKSIADVPKPAEGYIYETQFQALDKRVVKQVGEENQKTLRHLAEASVLADYCPLVKLDRTRFKDSFDALARPAPKTPRKPAEQREFENRLMTYFGVYVGLMVAEGAASGADLCELAARMQKNQAPVSQFWQTAATTPPTGK